MSSSTELTVVRAILLLFGVFAFLGATVLFDLLVRRPWRAYLRLAERMTGKPVVIPGRLGVFLDSEPLMRAWNGVWAVVFLALWWYLGTAAGAARFAALFSQ